MESVDFDNVKAEKSMALKKYQRFRSISFLFRAIEICLALLFLCWIYTCLPFAVQISGELFRRLASVVSTPLFMFFLGNSIVIALLMTKSTARTISGGAEAEFYDAFIRSGENCDKPLDGDLTEEIVYDDKQMIVDTELNSNTNSNLNLNLNPNSNSTMAREDEVVIDGEKDSISVTDQLPKIYLRSKSDISAKQSPYMISSKPPLRRSETEKCRKIVESYEELETDENYPEDNLTNEEFQKTIDEFIAKQLKFRRRESVTVVIHNQQA